MLEVEHRIKNMLLELLMDLAGMDGRHCLRFPRRIDCKPGIKPYQRASY